MQHGSSSQDKVSARRHDARAHGNHQRPCFALIVAAGRGTRAGEGVAKQYRPLDGQPVLRRALAPFLAHAGVDGVCVVIRSEDRADYDAATAGLSLLPPVIGGELRQASVRLGLDALKDRTPATVLIHDAARPLVDGATITAVMNALETFVGAVPTLAVPDTLKRVSGLTVETTIARDGVASAQTPQGFRYPEILAAHHKAADLG